MGNWGRQLRVKKPKPSLTEQKSQDASCLFDDFQSYQRGALGFMEADWLAEIPILPSWNL